MLKKSGFTLIELLVVIAIITILASIVAPKVQGWIERGKMAKAVSEVRNADLALVKMLSDVERKTFGQLFTISPSLSGPNAASPTLWTAAAKLYSDVFYELLRRGKEADYNHATGLMNITYTENNITYTVRLDPTVAKKLGTTYMDINLDPWGKAYQFYAGPLKLKKNLDVFPNDYPPFRAYRDADYFYDVNAKAALDTELRGNPPVDKQPGFPCPTDLSVYIYSMGGNQIPNQPWLATPDSDLGNGGGDDINNWDTQSGWGSMY